MNKISSKIIISILLSTILVATMIALLSLSNASDIITEEAHKTFGYAAKNYGQLFNATFSNAELSVDSVIAFVQSTFDLASFTSDPAYRDDFMSITDTYLLEYASTLTNTQGIYVIVNPELTNSVYESWYIKDTNGTYIYQESEPLSDFYVENEDMAWYYEPIKERDGVWIEPYVDATIGVHMISFTKPIYRKDELIGVVGVDLAFTDLQSLMKEMVLYESGYSFLLNDDYAVLLHPTVGKNIRLSELPNEPLTPVIDAMNKYQSDVIDYQFEGKDKIMGFTYLTNGWILGIVSDSSDVFQPITTLRKRILGISIVSILIMAIIGIFISKSITKPIYQLRDMTYEISKGNHEIILDLNSTNEIGELSKSINIMTRNLMDTHYELKDMSDELHHMAYHDALTGLPNRRFGKNKLETLMEEHHKTDSLTAVMFIDLDNFKIVNDTHGHNVGDKLLVEVTESMKSCLRDHDTIFRLGGDEFMITLSSILDTEQIVTIANRILLSLSTPYMIDDLRLNISCSMGIAFIGEHGDDVETIMKNADIALYTAKESGRNTYRFYSK